MGKKRRVGEERKEIRKEGVCCDCCFVVWVGVVLIIVSYSVCSLG